MRKFTSLLAVALIATCASTASATTENGRLFIIGNALSYGYSLDPVQALIATPQQPGVFTGTIYLKANEEFKFMENSDWGGIEYGIPESGPVSGEITIVSGTNDEGYSKLSVAEAGNYLISVDTQNLKMTITKSVWQESEINICSMFMVGNATAGGWSIDNGTPLYQVAETPYIYVNPKTALTATDADNNAASFKITTALRGGFDAKYWLFRDAEDSGKISTDGTDDRQWNVTENGDYTVTVNTRDNTISIATYQEPKPDPDPEPDPEPDDPEGGITTVSSDNANIPTAYYNLCGERVANPTNGIYIVVTSQGAKKVFFK